MRRLPLLAALAVAAAPLLAAGGYGLRLLTSAGIYALLAAGYQAIFGAAGALSLAQGAFFGLGAYVTGILGARYGLDGAATLVLSAAVPAALAAAVAAPVLRLESHYFALATLGIAQLLLLAAVNAEALTGGANGLPGVPGLRLFGLPVERGWPLMAAVWAVALGAAALVGRWSGGARAPVLALMREDPIAAASLGIDTGRLRFAAFLLAAAAAGLAGALHAHFLGVVSPEAIEFPVMVACLSMLVVGGRLSVAGAVLGALLLVQLPEWLRFIGPWYLAVYGAALLAAIVFAPEGIAGVAARLAHAPLPRLPPPAAPRAMPRETPAGPLLSLDGVTKRFGGITALDRVDLDIAAGELVGIIGPNGSGKTTLVNAISGIVAPDSGALTFRGVPLAGRAAHRIARLGVARGFQTPRLLDDAAALDNVALGAHGRGDAAALALYWLDRLGIGGLATRRCGDLPGGARRRVEIARALAVDPRLLLLDEPAAGLTPEEQDDLAMRLRLLNAEGLTILVVEHSVPFLKGLARRMVCLVEGRVVADGAPDAVTRDPVVIDAYLGRNWERRP
jgi:branched-chain amino acid transport system permease protein